MNRHINDKRIIFLKNIEINFSCYQLRYINIISFEDETPQLQLVVIGKELLFSN